MAKPAEAAGRILRDHVAAETGASQHAAARERLIEAVHGGSRRRGRGWLVAVAIAAATAAAVLLWVMRPSTGAAVAFTVGADAPGEIGRFYSPPAQKELSLSFPEGSRVRLAPGAGARVSRADQRGATVLLENGRAHVDVTARPEASWKIVAGPYTVRVTGTSFWVSWATETGELEVVMEKGAVVVRGPSLESGVTVSAGERFVTRVTSRLETETTASSSSAPGPAPPAPPPDSARAEPAAPPVDLEPEPAEPRWSELAARGEHRRVIEAAEARGVDSVISNGSLEDLAALADAARFTGRGAVAQRALRALRARFPGSARAKSAAFVLGRMLDDGGNPSGALTWYDTYLSEAPGGALSAEALGRRMLALQRLGRGDEARQSARDYLKRFPKGPYAAQAEKLVNH